MTKFNLRLFLSGTTGASQRAVDNLMRICESELQGNYELEVIDVLERPDLAEQARILATPTLVKELPEPVRKIIGDLSDRQSVLVALDLARLDSGPLR